MTDTINRGKIKSSALIAAAGLLLAVAGVTASTGAAAGAPAPAAAPQIAVSAPDAGTQVTPGNATLFFDWFCDGSYSSAGITFVQTVAGVFTSGTFTTSDGGAGIWVRLGGPNPGNPGGQLVFTFNGLETTYTSVVANKASAGIQTTFGNPAPLFSGCHHIVSVPLVAALNDDSQHADGSPVKR